MPELNSTGTTTRAWTAGDELVVVNEGGGSPDTLARVSSGVPHTALAGGVLNNLTASAAPTVTNDSAGGYAVGSRWLWAARALEWVCVDATVGAARWALVRQDFLNPSNALGPLVNYKLRHFYGAATASSTFDEHLTTYNENGSFITAQSYNSGVDGQIGILSFRTGANALLQRPTLGGGYSRSLNVSGSPIRTVIAARVRFQPSGGATPATNAPSATNDYHFAFGFQPNNGDREATDYVRLDYRWTGSAVEFAARRRAGSGTVQSVALTAPTANTWMVLAVTVSNGLVEYYIDGVLVASATTTIPTAEMRDLMMINQTTAANVNGVDCDWLATMTIGHAG